MNNALRFGLIGLTLVFCVLLSFQASRDSLSKIPAIEGLLKTRSKVQRKAQITLINFYMPKDFTPFFEIARGNSAPNFSLEFTNYFQNITEVFPMQADAYLALAICRYYNQNPVGAIELLQKSALIDPIAFWPRYNLGLILFQNQRHAEAAAALQQAVTINPRQAIQSMLNSRVYQQIIQTHQPFPLDLSIRLKEGYANSILLLTLISHELNKNTDAEPSKIEELQQKIKRLQPTIF